MGSRPYTQLENIELNVDQTNIVLEIGSENGEGSSVWLYNWANLRSIQFYSIDVVERNRAPSEINWIIHESGSNWCKTFLPTLNKKIKVLYLDNFDWYYEGWNYGMPRWVQYQIDSYKQRGVVMNNQNCQEEHKLQLEYCLPYLDDQSVVFFDDTFYNSKTMCLDGKGATAIPLLLKHGFKMHGTEYATRGCK